MTRVREGRRHSSVQPTPDRAGGTAARGARRPVSCLAAAALVAGPAVSGAQPAYHRHLLFDNSLTPERYYHSAGRFVAPSRLVLDRGRLPVDATVARTPPNALRLEWTSAPGGSWEASVHVNQWRNREPVFLGDALSFWCYSREPLRAVHLPHLRLRDASGASSAAVDLSRVAPDIPAGRWTQIELPLSAFAAPASGSFDPHRIATLTVLQGASDGTPHTLLVDEVKVDGGGAPAAAPAAPRALEAMAYERHVDLRWAAGAGGEPQRYVVYRSFDGVRYEPIGVQEPSVTRYADFLGEPGRRAFYKVTASDRAYRESPFSPVAEATTRQLDDEGLLTMVQEASFRYYWEGAHPVSGMALENIPGDPRIVAAGASGFGIMALVVGVERGFVARDEGARRLLRIVEFLERADRFHGAWPHFLDGATGKVIHVFGQYDNGGDLVETAFLVQGLLTARQYFTRDDDVERRIVRAITALWRGVEWDWYRKRPDGRYLYWHWSPDYAWHINHKLIGFNETLIAYVLAIASPTHAVPAELYYSGWASQSDEAAEYRQGWGGTREGDRYANGTTYHGITLDVGVGRGGPLFFTHYSYLGLDPRAVRDRYTSHFENNRNIARINRAYVVEHPGGYESYGERCWGLTASDGPRGYRAHEPRLALDDGTMTPTGALASFPYLPDASMAALKYFYRELGDRLWGVYGFRDAFNLTEDWVAPIYMGLNQAPITVMIENHRSGLPWKLFMANPEIQPALERIARGV